MHAPACACPHADRERDHLVTVVFPDPSASLRAGLRERLEQLGLELVDVDLRWGVPETGVDGEYELEKI